MFANFYEVNIPTVPISSGQHEITEHGIQKETIISCGGLLGLVSNTAQQGD